MESNLINFAPLIVVAIVALAVLFVKKREHFPKMQVLWFAYGFLASQLIMQLVNWVRSA